MWVESKGDSVVVMVERIKMFGNVCTVCLVVRGCLRIRANVQETLISDIESSLPFWISNSL